MNFFLNFIYYYKEYFKSQGAPPKKEFKTIPQNNCVVISQHVMYYSQPPATITYIIGHCNPSVRIIDLVSHYGGKSTTDQIFTLRQILEKTHETQVDTYHLFVDYKAGASMAP